MVQNQLSNLSKIAADAGFAVSNQIRAVLHAKGTTPATLPGMGFTFN